jgi:hypothetical protein
MRCEDAASLLERWTDEDAPASPVDPGWLDEAVRSGWLAHADPATDGAALEALQERMHALRERREGLVLVLSAAAGAAEADTWREVAGLETEERELRTLILDHAERAAASAEALDVGGRRLRLAWRGRELLDELGPRLWRIRDAPVEDFLRELQLMRTSLTSVASRAAAIATQISPQARAVDEARCRAAAAGLASQVGSPDALAKAWLQVVDTLSGGLVPVGMHAVAAECLCLGPVAAGPADVAALAEQARALLPSCPSLEDAVTCALLLWPVKPDQRASILAGAMAVGRVGDRAPLVLLGLAGEDPKAVERFVAMEEAIQRRVGADGEADTAAALLGMRAEAPEASLERWTTCYEALSWFSPKGVAVPAAMLCLLDADPEEALDDLRLAAAEVQRAQLCVGGLENLALGVKLLLQQAIAGSAGLLAPLGAPALRPVGAGALAASLPVGLVAAGAVQAMSSFHARTVYRNAAVYASGWNATHHHYSHYG